MNTATSGLLAGEERLPVLLHGNLLMALAQRANGFKCEMKGFHQ